MRNRNVDVEPEKLVITVCTEVGHDSEGCPARSFAYDYHPIENNEHFDIGQKAMQLCIHTCELVGMVCCASSTTSSTDLTSDQVGWIV